MSTTYYVSSCEELSWDLAEKQALSPCVWSPTPPPFVTMQALWQPGKALSFRLESEAPPSRAENREADSPVWQDDCLECFFTLDGLNYVNMEANANGALLSAVGPDRSCRTPLAHMALPRPTVRCKPRSGGWEAVFSVSAETLRQLFGKELAAGLCVRANFYACGDLTPRPYYAAWSRVDTPTPDFHRPDFFGSLVLL